MQEYKELSLKLYIKNVCHNCVSFHNSGHKKESQLAKKYNSWCCKLGKSCSNAVGECKLNKLYEYYGE